MSTDEHLPAADGLPDGWVWTTLGQCVEILDRYRIPVNSEERQRRIAGKSSDQLYPYYGATQQVGWIDDYLFDEELVLLGEDGVPFLDPMRPKAYIIRGKSWVNNHAHVLRAIRGLTSNAFIHHYLNTFDYHGYVTGTTRLKLNQTRMKIIPVLLPPLAEQRRIVAKIEALFQQSRRGREALDVIPDLLAQFRQAVLAAAFRGELTERYLDDEPASVLLERIRAERRRQWEKDLRAKGKDASRSEYQEPAPPDTSDLPELPEGWVWVTIREVAEVVTGTTPSKKDPANYGDHIPFVKPPQLNDCWITGAEESLSEEGARRARVLPPDAVLVSCIGILGKTGITDMPVAFNQQINAMVFPAQIYPLYAFYYFQSAAAKAELAERASATTVTIINKSRFMSVPMPLPSTDDQRRIVARIEALFAQADILEAQVAAARRRLAQVDQAILARAFRGELVEQDPEDEPASVLLEQIRKGKS